MEIAGFRVPDSEICVAATDYARELSEPFLFNHCMRTYGFGALAGQAGSQSFDHEVLYLGAVLHDLGLTEAVPVTNRFEVDGADAAKAFLSERGFDDRKIELIWDAIALHTITGIPQRKVPEIALVQMGAGIDVGAIPREILSADSVDAVLDAWPRLGFKKAMVEAFVRMVERNAPSVALGVVADIAERKIPGFERRNICDAFEHAAFSD